MAHILLPQLPRFFVVLFVALLGVSGCVDARGTSSVREVIRKFKTEEKAALKVERAKLDEAHAIFEKEEKQKRREFFKVNLDGPSRRGYVKAMIDRRRFAKEELKRNKMKLNTESKARIKAYEQRVKSEKPISP